MFDGVGSLKLSREEGDIFTINAFPALKWRLEKKYREVNNIKLKEVVKISGLHRARKSLIDNLKVSCSQERLFEIINNLDEDVKELFYKYYGEQLDSKCAVGINDDELFIVRNALYTIKKELSQVQVVKRYKYVSLVEAFDNRYTISQINFAIQLLSEEERELLHMRFGPSFTGFITEFGPLKSVSLTAKQVTRIIMKV